jgi:hypothetical protein
MFYDTRVQNPGVKTGFRWVKTHFRLIKPALRRHVWTDSNQIRHEATGNDN